MSAIGSSTDVGRDPRVRSLVAHVARSRPYRMSSGQVAIWALSGVVISAAALLYMTGAGDVAPVISSVHVPFWVLVIGFAAAERLVVHVHFRRSAHSMSLAEIPLVFALVFAGGSATILAGAIGRILVLAFHRKLPLIRLAFNFAVFLLGNCVAVIVFHAVAGASSDLRPIVWAAAILATVANSLIAMLCISLAVSLSEGQLSIRQVALSLRTDLAVVVANTSVGLCAATILYKDWQAAILMAVPVAGMFVSFQAYVTERQRHARVEFLYRAARALSHAPEIGPALEGLLGQALDAFRAEVAEIIFLSPDGSDALRTTVRANGSDAVLEPVDPGIAARFRVLIEDQDGGACAARDIGDGRLVEYLRARELGDGMLAVLKGERSLIGAMTIGNPSGVVDHFCPEDVKLLETLANNTSVALENDRLGQTVWRLKELQRELQHQASHDPLTDLANRSLFVQRVGDALSDAPDGVSVIFIDIDDFKTVNDSLGHAAGDDLLIVIARRLRDCVRPSDTVARLGGDEFAIMLDRPDSQREAIEVTERINRHLAERFSICGQNISVHASAGIATSHGSQVSPEELIRNADLAMYRAKHESKDRYELFKSDMELQVKKRHRLKVRLKDAVRDDSFVVHYQPIVELETGRVAACEALLRWPDGPRGCSTPSSFIPLAEEIGAVVPIGRSVLGRACRDAQTWAWDGTVPAAIHVNVSPVELRQRRFVEGVAAALDQSELEPRRLVLEITEGAMLHDPERSIATLQELRALGVQLALDDFGTGYSSLGHLRSLPIDWLKIGMPFMDSLEHGGWDRAFIRMVLDLAANLELGVVAEGIESPGQLASLRELGCEFGQGFYLGLPTTLDPVERAAQCTVMG
ncbi:MAG: EAL domain-containing protein [Solirubrobacterales bacterium]|nr:EAL domain-containing protein [Solirubrobacterales bacterium]